MIKHMNELSDFTWIVTWTVDDGKNWQSILSDNFEEAQNFAKNLREENADNRYDFSFYAARQAILNTNDFLSAKHGGQVKLVL